MTTTLRALLERVEAASGPDRDLDTEILVAVDRDDAPLGIFYTESVDAVLGLIERVLPGWRWELTTTGFKPGASLIAPGQNCGAYAAMPALALLAALLKAKIAQQEPTR